MYASRHLSRVGRWRVAGFRERSPVIITRDGNWNGNRAVGGWMGYRCGSVLQEGPGHREEKACRIARSLAALVPSCLPLHCPTSTNSSQKLQTSRSPTSFESSVLGMYTGATTNRR